MDCLLRSSLSPFTWPGPSLFSFICPSHSLMSCKGLSFVACRSSPVPIVAFSPLSCSSLVTCIHSSALDNLPASSPGNLSVCISRPDFSSVPISGIQPFLSCIISRMQALPRVHIRHSAILMHIP
ncbi:Uncharacterized protein DAT39_000002 [Clarias magur]|uniref:Uncharacterized protein n=1 Tax=Clarias magur TaxID=1594786 RepID=A0A8J4XHL4_CLAMG|nr:Uncharacterized protein DAT39_000002 [Clarias magur]